MTPSTPDHRALCVCVCVYEAATQLSSNKAQGGSIVVAPVLKNPIVGERETNRSGKDKGEPVF